MVYFETTPVKFTNIVPDFTLTIQKMDMRLQAGVTVVPYPVDLGTITLAQSRAISPDQPASNVTYTLTDPAVIPMTADSESSLSYRSALYAQRAQADWVLPSVADSITTTITSRANKFPTPTTSSVPRRNGAGRHTILGQTP